ncbi:MAG TPA: hypothetical protein VFW40_14015 [Capsulimonadaceae bacterium]|nr:hypothetical protein [Capsulimonadaceae bacterium]
MTILNGDTCRKCGYAFGVFDRGPCPRCQLLSMSAFPVQGRACRPWFSADMLRQAGYVALWGSLALVAAAAAFMATVGWV